ncbi:hypothetical protein CN155_21305 [Sinorhizobium meliloti]|nr:hypothetical protein CN155_21305 [Sinorhizobium meliloti]
MTNNGDIRIFDERREQYVWDVTAYCRRMGIDEAEAKRLIKILGRYASNHELQMNIVRPHRRRP